MNVERMETPIVCDMTVFNEENRKSHESQSMKYTKEAKRIIELTDGFAFHHDYQQERFIEMAHWMTQENRCCPFFTFALIIEPYASGREIVLKLTGNNTIKTYLADGLKQLNIQLKD